MNNVKAVCTALACSFLMLSVDLHAETRKLGLEFLTSSQQQELWKRTDDDAGYAALLQKCGRGLDFERRFVAAVQACVSPAAIRQVVSYYRDRYAFTLAHASNNPCADAYFSAHGLAEKLKAMLERQIGQAARYCSIYLKTEVFIPQ